MRSSLIAGILRTKPDNLFVVGRLFWDASAFHLSFRAKKVNRVDVQSTRNRRRCGHDCGKQDDEAGSRQLNEIGTLHLVKKRLDQTRRHESSVRPTAVPMASAKAMPERMGRMT